MRHRSLLNPPPDNETGIPPHTWGVIGLLQAVELGVGIAIGFLAVGFIVGLFWGLIRQL